MLVSDFARTSGDRQRTPSSETAWSRVPARTNQTATPESTICSSLQSVHAGIEQIYTALDDLVAAFHLDDAAVVLDEPTVGRQVFRAGRTPIEHNSNLLLEAAPGLYTKPELTADQINAESFLTCCSLALHLEMLRYDAWHDSLTGLFDRRSFEHLLDMSVARSRRYDWSFTLVLIDIDYFKAFNDHHGHAGGDRSLKALADRFQTVLRIGDVASRIGGDEFALILPNADPREIPDLLTRIARSPASPIPCPPFSFGWARCPSDATEAEKLFEIADHALYAHKASRPQGA